MFYPIESAVPPISIALPKPLPPEPLPANLSAPFIGLKLSVPVFPISPFCIDIGLFKLKLFCVRE
nr:MAG TPA: hypothetical protein [Caudoviricetes sp.]